MMTLGEELQGVPYLVSRKGQSAQSAKMREEGRGVLFPLGGEEQVRGGEQKWRVGSAAVVTETSKPSPLGLLHLGSHLHLGELKWEWAGCQLRDSPANQEKKRKRKKEKILQPIRKRKERKRKGKIIQPIRKRKKKKKKKRGGNQVRNLASA